MSVWTPAIALLLSLAALFAGTFGACGDDDGPAPSPSVVPATGTAGDGNIPSRVLERVADDLGLRLGVPGASVTVVEVCAVRWPDGSIGVAEPGMVYTPAIVDGWLAILEVAGREYRYHGAGERFVAADFVAGADVDSVRCP